MASRGQAREVTQPSWLHGKREGTRSAFGHLFRASKRSRRRRDRPIRARKGIGLYFPRPKPSDCVFADARRSRKARVTRLETHPLSTPRRERVSAMVSVSKLLAMQWDCVGKGRRGRGERGLKETLGLQSFVGSNLALRFPKKPKNFNFVPSESFGPRSLRRQTRFTRESRGRRGLWVDIARGFDSIDAAGASRSGSGSARAHGMR